LQGFWAGYFAARAAPMGRVGAGPVTAAFYNFHPDMVRQAVPACWDVVSPEDLTLLRAQAAAVALGELCSAQALTDLTEALVTLQGVVAHAEGDGRVLTGVNRSLGAGLGLRLEAAGVVDSALGVAEAWQACTALREHRGDGHVAALVGHDLSGLEAHLLAAGVHGVPAEVLRDNRGWSDAAWSAGLARLADRGLLEIDGTATGAGRALHQRVEALTDSLAEVPFRALSDVEVNALYGVLRACAAEVQASGLLPFPNPMGLPTLN
jgi:hypothetical protein